MLTGRCLDRGGEGRRRRRRDAEASDGPGQAGLPRRLLGVLRNKPATRVPPGKVHTRVATSATSRLLLSSHTSPFFLVPAFPPPFPLCVLPHFPCPLSLAFILYPPLLFPLSVRYPRSSSLSQWSSLTCPTLHYPFLTAVLVRLLCLTSVQVARSVTYNLGAGRRKVRTLASLFLSPRSPPPLPFIPFLAPFALSFSVTLSLYD